MTTTTTRRFTHDQQFGTDPGNLAPFPTQCPPWCTVGDGSSHYAFHLDYEADDRRPQERHHTAPSFGHVEIFGIETLADPGVVKLRTSFSVSQYARDAAGLRTLAADAIAAAEWMEAHA